MALLATEALDLGNGKTLNAGFLKRLLHFVELERLDDRFDLLHLSTPPLRCSWKVNHHFPGAGTIR